MDWTRRFFVYGGLGMALPAIIVLAVALALLLALAYHLHLLYHFLGTPPRLLVGGITALWSYRLEDPAAAPIILAFPTRR